MTTFQRNIPAWGCIICIACSLLFAAPKATAASPDTATLSIDVKDTDIRDVIRMISKGYNLNILLDQDVSGKVTLHLSDVPILEGLKSIAASNGLSLSREGSVYKLQKSTAEQKNLIRYINGKLTVDIQNVDVKDFLKELSVKTAASIVPDAKVIGTLSGKLFEVDLEDGLRALLEANGFKLYKRKNIFQVMTGESQGTAPDRGYAPGRQQSASRSNFYVDFTNGLLSVDVTNGDLEDVVRAITEQSDIQIITYGDIKTEINAKLSRVPLTEGLALLLGGTRFTFVQKDKVILLGDRNTTTPSGQALSKSELVHLKHIKADNVPAILPKDIPPTNVRVIKEQNALLISGTSEDIVTAREFLNTIDIPTPQVRINAVIVEYKENLDREFGLRYGKDNALMDRSYTITPAPETQVSKAANEFEFGMSGKYLKDLLRSLDMGNILRINELPDNFFAVLRFLESQDKAKVLAQPSILTLNGNKASIDVSETQYFKISTGYGENYSLRFQPIKFGITLDITPWISQSGQITAEITPAVSNSEKVNNDGYPNVSTRSITTTVRLNNGETLILGGLVKNQETQFRRKIPILGDIPILGALFSYSGKTRTKSNLVVYITPHIVTNDEHVNLTAELERQDLQGRSFIDRKVHQGAKGFKSMFGQPKADTSSGTTGRTGTVAPVSQVKQPVKTMVRTVNDSLIITKDEKMTSPVSPANVPATAPAGNIK